MTDFYSLSGDQLVLLSSVVAIILAKGLNADQVNTLGNFITLVGTSLTTIAGQLQLVNDDSQNGSQSKKEDTKNQVEDLKF
ncbi:hypothetical protein [Clostridium thermarum]|uniref:hypothetical protein n=1 Tax=Clostridium thermarum TaxID=1716543 RepID=UPI0013D646DB|nr:hypothetical protein [Clostridium thermarum]